MLWVKNWIQNLTLIAFLTWYSNKRCNQKVVTLSLTCYIPWKVEDAEAFENKAFSHCVILKFVLGLALDFAGLATAQKKNRVSVHHD